MRLARLIFAAESCLNTPRLGGVRVRFAESSTLIDKVIASAKGTMEAAIYTHALGVGYDGDCRAFYIGEVAPRYLELGIEFVTSVQGKGLKEASTLRVDSPRDARRKV